MAISDSVKVLERFAQNEKRRADKAQKDLDKAESIFNEKISRLEETKSLKEKSLEDDEEDLPPIPHLICKGCKLFESSILSGFVYALVILSDAIGLWGSKEED